MSPYQHWESHCGDKMVLSPQWDFLYWWDNIFILNRAPDICPYRDKVFVFVFNRVLEEPVYLSASVLHLFLQTELPIEEIIDCMEHRSSKSVLQTILDANKPWVSMIGGFNSLKRSNKYKCQWTRSLLIQVMACCLHGTKPLPEPMSITYLMMAYVHIRNQRIAWFSISILSGYTE